MTEPLRRAPATGKSPEDLGDVLASIRRLIAQEGAASPPADEAGAGGPVVREPVVLHPAEAPPQPTAALARAVDAAAARMADTARRIEAARAAQDAPFRLNPDALIPPAEQPAWAEPRRRLTPGPLAEAAMMSSGAGGAVAALPVADVVGGASSADLPHEALPVAAVAQKPEPSDLAPLAPQPEPSQQESAAMQLTADRHHATITPHPSAAQMPPLAAQPQPGIADAAAEAPLLRHLLREAIRAELSAELGDRLDGELRQMVRQEIASALSAALSDALRLPARG